MCQAKVAERLYMRHFLLAWVAMCFKQEDEKFGMHAYVQALLQCLPRAGMGNCVELSRPLSIPG